MPINPNIYQDVLQISETVNCLITDAGTAPALRATFPEELSESLKVISGEWEIAWGPAVWEKESSAQIQSDNLFQVAGVGHVTFVGSGRPVFEDNRVYKTLVVAIGITAGLQGLYDELSDVDRVIDVDQWAGSGIAGLKSAPKIVENKPSALKAGGTYIANGLGQALFQLINHSPANGNSVTLLDYLEGVGQKEDTKIVFTGHSLGGALASSLAYALAKAGMLGSSPSNHAYVYSTGAPSLGNQVFVQKFSDYFPSPEGPLQGYRFWNVNIVNPLDIVPYAYCTDEDYDFNLGKIPSMYENPSYPGALTTVRDIVNKLKEKTNSLYYPLKSSTFESPIPKPPISPYSTIGFLFSAGQQHISAYKAYILADGGRSEGESSKT